MQWISRVGWLTFVMAIFTAQMVNAASVPQRGDLVFTETFEDTEAAARWQIPKNSSDISLLKADPSATESGQWLRIAAPNDNAGNFAVRLSLPKTWLAKLVGCQLLCQAKVRAVDVSEPPQSWNGVKWMLHFTTPTGDVWLQENQACGTFDWRTVQFVALVPENATAAELVLGLEKVHGIAEFDDLSIRVYRPRIQLPTTPIPGQGPNGTAYIGHTGQGNRTLTCCQANDLREEADIPAGHATFHGDAFFVGVLL